MNCGTIVEIHTFDDGNQMYKQHKNKWIIEETMYNGSKLKLKNQANSEIIIYSISSWKIRIPRHF
jgi:hypothetical protein